MKKFLIVFLGLLSNQLFSQSVESMYSLADSLRLSGNLKGAAAEYKKKWNTERNNYLQLACYVSVEAIQGNKDSCFKYLPVLLSMDTSLDLLTDPDLINIKDDKRWNLFEDKVANAVVLKYKKPYKDLEYAKILWRMYALDQAYYTDMEMEEKINGPASPLISELWKKKKSINEQNQTQLLKLIKEKGWPKLSDVNGRAASSAFLIIQHSDIEKQKQFLPTIEELCKVNEANWESYALMYDRIQMEEGKPQKYGSQVTRKKGSDKWELHPLLDETKVDEWRKECGMGPLADYLSNFEINFVPKK